MEHDTGVMELDTGVMELDTNGSKHDTEVLEQPQADLNKPGPNYGNAPNINETPSPTMVPVDLAPRGGSRELKDTLRKKTSLSEDLISVKRDELYEEVCNDLMVRMTSFHFCRRDIS